MNVAVLPRLRTLTGFVAILAGLAIMAPMPAQATGTVTLTAVPKQGFENVSLTLSSKPPYYVTYQIKINNSTSSAIEKFSVYGSTVASLATVEGSPAVFVPPSSAANCVQLAGQTAYRNWQVKCKADTLPVGETVWDVTFQSPTAGDKLTFKWNKARLKFPNDFEYDGDDEHEDEGGGIVQLPGGSVAVNLITQTTTDIATGFKTIVPVGGGTFFTGFSDAFAPGGVATTSDPYTTTVRVPGISFATTATAEESPSTNPCQASFKQCFVTDLNVPGQFQVPITPTATNPDGIDYLVVTLRIDVTKLAAGGTLLGAVISYTHNFNDLAHYPITPLLNCADMPNKRPEQFQPCIAARKKYPSTAPAAWRYDWEFTIWALDNGRFLF